MRARTYLYKLTSDRGGAPCAPPPRAGADPLLTLSICKPAIRRTAQPGDRLLGLTSHSLVNAEHYPADAVLYAAIVTSAQDARDYYAPRSPFRSRPDCIYQFHRDLGTLTHTGRTTLHDDPAYEARDIGRYPFYRNGRALLSTDFRYFGSAAVPLRPHFPALARLSQLLAQGHRVLSHSNPSTHTPEDPATAELDRLFDELWSLPTRYTPAVVHTEARGHAPKTQSGRGHRGRDPLL